MNRYVESNKELKWQFTKILTNTQIHFCVQNFVFSFTDGYKLISFLLANFRLKSWLSLSFYFDPIYKQHIQTYIYIVWIANAYWSRNNKLNYGLSIHQSKRKANICLWLKTWNTFEFYNAFAEKYGWCMRRTSNLNAKPWNGIVQHPTSDIYIFSITVDQQCLI